MYFYSLNQENVISLWGLVNQAEPSLWSQTAVLNRNRLSTIMNSDNFKAADDDAGKLQPVFLKRLYLLHICIFSLFLFTASLTTI